MKKLTIALTVLMGVCSSCSQDNETTAVYDHATPMSVVTDIVQSRAMISNTSLPDKAELGVTLVENKDGATQYDGLTDGYCNVLYRANGNAPAQTWTAVDKPIYLSATDGKAVAYFPYNSSQSDYKTLTVQADGQIDYLYSGWFKPISNSTPEAKFEMKHALTGICINLKKGTYTAAGKVEEIRIESPAIGIEGNLDASTGKVTNVTKGEVNTDMMNPAFKKFTLEETSHGTMLMVVPIDGQIPEVTITVGVDGKQYLATGKISLPLKQGNVYTFDLTLNNTALEVSGEVSVIPWVVDDSASTDNGGVLQPTN